MIRSFGIIICSGALFFALFLLSGCSAERKNVISKGYHNTTARFNAVFYAKNRIAEIESIIEDNHDNNYDQILRIYPPYDSVMALSYKEQSDDAIKKASIAIERHKNSKFVDDAYLLVGIARMYDTDYVNAVETFKYVFKNGEDRERVLALAYLMRSYTDDGEYRNGLEVSGYLDKEKLNKEEAKVVYINRAYMYQMIDDENNMVQNLVKAAPLLKRKDGKGRLYFIIGQVYESLGFESEAYGYYRQCIGSNPEYELDFHARIRMAQVAELKGASDVKSTRKLFEKLLTDKKNKQFIDKIYYEMGEFEAKQGNLDQAIDNYKLALGASTQANRQKSLSYLRLGQIYFDSLKRYSLAKSYYDSTIQILPKDFEDYEKIARRQAVLADFVEQIDAIQLQDSLLVLAGQDSLSTRRMIRSQLQQQDSIQQEKEERAEKERERTARRNNNILLGNNTGFSSTNWYFDSPAAVAQGQSEFRRIWGDRPLEDHWRRSNKQVFKNYDEQAAIQADDDVPVEMQDPEEVAAAIEARLEDRTNALMETIPYSKQEQLESLGIIENALFRLGNIYYFDLEEENNATLNFVSLIERFPESEHVPEVLYQLILIHEKSDPQKASVYKEKLLNEFPNTTYAHLIRNPNYDLENSQAVAAVKRVYAQAYQLYNQGEYAFALDKLDSALQVSPETSFTPQMDLLRILVLAKNESKETYEGRLESFIQEYPDFPITPYAQELLEKSQNFNTAASRKEVVFSENRNQEHYFVMVYDNVNGGEQLAVTETIQLYNTLNWDEQQLKLSTLQMEGNRRVSILRSFENGREAYRYFKEFEKKGVIPPATLTTKSYTFVITKDNFDILYQSRDLASYMQFFDKNYRNGIYEQGQ
ncbi:methyltransferase [Fulvivirga sedimenti]|uniref:Methyltransferase n=1 Tax=Fulvivirga sedimenti TaxID=2879465 RepID=A0A9X1L2L1_9BACT|nr:methyltransferase [Fulvivirga sedimenti]MCA6078316.1 methyltransferase [Fulvivirga sedimenti]